MKILVTGAWSNAEEAIPLIEAMGHKVYFLSCEKEELPCSCGDVEAVICNSLFLYHPIEKFINLRYVQLTSAGYDRAPMDYIEQYQIEIHNAGGVYSIPMAEFAVCGVLQLYKQSRFFYENKKRRLWKKHRGLLELSGKTVGIIGCGSVGDECAKRFSAFGCRVIGVNRSIREYADYEKIWDFNRLDALLPDCDIVILSLALTKETHHLINRDRLNRMKPGAILVNLARGAIIDTEALADAMEHLGGAVLDVFEEEPLPEESTLWQMEKVILTPHNSFVGEGNQERMRKVILGNLKMLTI